MTTVDGRASPLAAYDPLSRESIAQALGQPLNSMARDQDFGVFKEGYYSLIAAYLHDLSHFSLLLNSCQGVVELPASTGRRSGADQSIFISMHEYVAPIVDISDLGTIDVILDRYAEQKKATAETPPHVVSGSSLTSKELSLAKAYIAAAGADPQHREERNRYKVAYNRLLVMYSDDIARINRILIDRGIMPITERHIFGPSGLTRAIVTSKIVRYIRTQQKGSAIMLEGGMSASRAGSRAGSRLQPRNAQPVSTGSIKPRSRTAIRRTPQTPRTAQTTKAQAPQTPLTESQVREQLSTIVQANLRLTSALQSAQRMDVSEIRILPSQALNSPRTRGSQGMAMLATPVVSVVDEPKSALNIVELSCTGMRGIDEATQTSLPAQTIDFGAIVRPFAYEVCTQCTGANICIACIQTDVLDEPVLMVDAGTTYSFHDSVVFEEHLSDIEVDHSPAHLGAHMGPQRCGSSFNDRPWMVSEFSAEGMDVYRRRLSIIPAVTRDGSETDSFLRPDYMVDEHPGSLALSYHIQEPPLTASVYKYVQSDQGDSQAKLPSVDYEEKYNDILDKYIQLEAANALHILEIERLRSEAEQARNNLSVFHHDPHEDEAHLRHQRLEQHELDLLQLELTSARSIITQLEADKELLLQECETLKGASNAVPDLTASEPSKEPSTQPKYAQLLLENQRLMHQLQEVERTRETLLQGIATVSAVEELPDPARVLLRSLRDSVADTADS
ncbi:hypothetical protein GMRT_12717 [Giardia muris]|uniref:Uncharacterized protein n=1 Tax=Giardia muris TaxID=5742 RepID=A0A4Z1T3K1_GIAMU|nr:hypothetical protein GMRT_12717 [Giardia muris]|eukprot:TNJ28553.1 hypothetical protein GMRT_12717 [Giardia muris]